MPIIPNINNEALQLLPDIALWKQQIANAINERGGNANPNSAFTQLAQDIEDIENFQTTGFEYISEIYRPRTLMEAYNSREFLIAVNNDSVTKLNNSCFEHCNFLASVNLINLEEINSYNFAYCSNLETINLPLKRINGIRNFSDCPNLKNINLPELIEINGSDNFGNNKNLEFVNLPSVRIIMGQEFYGSTIKGSIVFGPLIKFYNYSLRGCILTSVKNISVGQDTNINLSFQFWTATNVIAEGQSGIDELNSNLYNNLLTKLYDHSEDGETRILQIGWLDYITPENIAYANAKGWTITN